MTCSEQPSREGAQLDVGQEPGRVPSRFERHAPGVDHVTGGRLVGPRSTSALFPAACT
ncbi:hypothetical protein [Streptosporangium sp. CA-115845]|uniref:hypothetical protein n=1 Tax=Streptosporangium sp. CA-115845 TaxID=3240071 RepID=UPI003D9428C9